MFPSNYPFEELYPVVVGRYRIDSAILYLSHMKNMTIVDLSNIKNIHQGMEASGAKKVLLQREDWFWNHRVVGDTITGSTGHLSANYVVCPEVVVFCVFCKSGIPLVFAFVFHSGIVQ